MLWVPGGGFAMMKTNQLTPAATYGQILTGTIGAWPAAWTALNGGDMSVALAEDAYGIMVVISGASASATATHSIVDIGVDPAGGTAFTTLIPTLNASLSSGQAGFSYYFPLFIKSGATFGARMAVDAAEDGRIVIRTFHRPLRPELVRVGSHVTCYPTSVAPTSTMGTPVTPGVSSAAGAWTSMGATTKDAWWWQLSSGYNDATLTLHGVHDDLGYGSATTPTLIVEKELMQVLGTEQAYKPWLTQNYECEVPSGQTLYARSTIDIALADTGHHVMAWGLGG